MQRKNILFLGFGDIATRVARHFPGQHLVAVARSPKRVHDSIRFWHGVADSAEIRAQMKAQPFDAVIVTLTPREYSEEGYRDAYVNTMAALIPVWQKQPPGIVLFVSSTSVYGQCDGEWVDEGSATNASGFAGQSIVEAEHLLASSGVKSCIVRFAGIYGPGRDFLLRQVRAGKGGSGRYTNRIHAEDCAGCIAHLLNRHFTHQPLRPVYLACDSEPAPDTEVRTWLAAQMGLNVDQLETSEGTRGGNKRCSNQLLLTDGYRLLFPSYRAGYRAILSAD